VEDLHGRHITVLGATGGLGPAVCETLLACGATVSAVSRRRTALDSLRADLRHHDRLNVAEGDVSDGASTEALFTSLEKGHGPLDGVVHVVGGFSFGTLADTADETVTQLTQGLFVSAVFATRAAVRRMAPRGKGRIVLTSGMTARKAAPNMAVYGALKAAVAHFVESMAAEVGPSGVTVNAILPGVIDTPINRRDMPKADPSRFVSPRDIAIAVMGLIGESGRSINGALVALPDRM
jgi:NAD(P)-dependent dehydrogenase (short-subunit alcohol dehydrogenase family)